MLAGLELRGPAARCRLAARLPARLRYDIVTHWLGSAPGTWEYQNVETGPGGARVTRSHRLTVKRRNDVVHSAVPGTRRLREFGRYGVEIRLGGKKLAATHFEFAPVSASQPRAHVQTLTPC